VHLRRDSAAGVRFLAAVREGRSLKASARAAGVGMETGYRWLREAFDALRNEDFGLEEARAALRCSSSRIQVWEQERLARRGDGRHHLAVDAAVEDAFWVSFAAGASVEAARRAAGVGRSTAYRWWRRRFLELRQQGVPVRGAARRLRVPPARANVWEAARQRAVLIARREAGAADRRAVRASARHVELLLQPRSRSKLELRDTRYWELMRSGLTNTAACKILGVTRRSGIRIRQRRRHQTAQQAQRDRWVGRYLSQRERLQIADLLRLGCSLRRIAAELGRSPSTIKRELDRHKDADGRYLPHTADHNATLQRRRPRPHKLVANDRLRQVVQRKLNRCWSPDEISGWLRLTHPADRSMWLCAETIYRALLVPGGQGLHKRYCRKLRTGRRLRRSRWLTGPGHGSAVRNMRMIDQRPPDVDAKREPGHWEGDLILGVGSASAMVTLRERITQYGIVVNLPHDHTAATVNSAVTGAFASVPPQLKKTLTWDQGVEMARHQELAAATGLSIYFAERSSPWQRGANENFNGLLRQYFPKGTNLSVHTPEHVDGVMRELNNRPRRTLTTGHQRRRCAPPLLRPVPPEINERMTWAGLPARTPRQRDAATTAPGRRPGGAPATHRPSSRSDRSTRRQATTRSRVPSRRRGAGAAAG